MNELIISHVRIVFPSTPHQARVDEPVSDCFQHIMSTFPALYYKKNKAGMFFYVIRLCVRQMNIKETVAWLYFKAAVKNFLGFMTNNYEVVVKKRWLSTILSSTLV